MRKYVFLVLSILQATSSIYAQIDTTQQIEQEIFLIDAYVKPEPPFTFILTFYTSESCLSNVLIDGKYDYAVSNAYNEVHSAKIDISKLKFQNKNVPFIIQTVDSLGNKLTSEEYDFDLPYEPTITEGSTLWTLCLFAGSVFLLPAPGCVINSDYAYFSLTKEIPIISFRSKSRNYPSSYLAFEYTYIFNSVSKNYLRFGYKRIFEINYLEYISPGITVYTNFLGQNGFSPELSVGLFTMFETFTVYTRYRYNIVPDNSKVNFQEINLGLYTRFFSIYL